VSADTLDSVAEVVVVEVVDIHHSMANNRPVVVDIPQHRDQHQNRPDRHQVLTPGIHNIAYSNIKIYFGWTYF
jgi:hypothetical protein